MKFLLAATQYSHGDSRNLVPSLYNGIDKFESIKQIPLVLANAIQIILAVVGVLAVIYIIYAGIQYITSSGDPQKVAAAKTGLEHAVIGIFLSASAYLIVEFLARRFS